MKKLKLSVLLLLSTAAMSVVPSSRIVLGDPINRPPFSIESARIVREGTFIRFLIRNYQESDTLYFTVNNFTLVVPPQGGSVEYEVIAPELSVPFQKVTYAFKVQSNQSESWTGTVDYSVIVVDTGFEAMFDMVEPFLITATSVMMVIAGIICISISIIIRRASVKGSSKTSKNRPRALELHGRDTGVT
jgi:hypothetical protein